MSTTQQHLLISDIREDIVMLKNGGGALILQVSAVNFDLLSDREQIAIISAFAQMLNSLNFSIQIVIYSERLNISSYLTLLDKAQQAQTNPMLAKMMVSYRQFVQTTIKENDVLDKKFYVVVPLYSLELGLTPSKENLERKIKTILLPRRDQIIRQLSRVGLKAVQLDNQRLIETFYNIYNGQMEENIQVNTEIASKIEVNLKKPQATSEKPTINIPKLTPAPVQNNPVESTPIRTQVSRTHPFVVEELEDNV